MSVNVSFVLRIPPSSMELREAHGYQRSLSSSGVAKAPCQEMYPSLYECDSSSMELWEAHGHRRNCSSFGRFPQSHPRLRRPLYKPIGRFKSYYFDCSSIRVLRHINDFDSTSTELREDHRIALGLAKPKNMERRKPSMKHCKTFYRVLQENLLKSAPTIYESR